MRALTGPSAGARVVLAIAGALAMMVGLTPTASAHIAVTSTDVAPGGYGVLSFRVPTESDTASTTELVIDFPDRTPITSVAVQPLPGWTATIRSKRLPEPEKTDDGEVDSYVSSVDWRADSSATAIKPGQFQLFNISAGPLPHEATLVFPTVQRYSDGKDVVWNEIGSGGAEPEHPAPTLQLSDRSPSTPPPSPSAGAPNDPLDSDALSVIAVVVAAVAAIIAVTALLRTRRPTA